MAQPTGAQRERLIEEALRAKRGRDVMAREAWRAHLADGADGRQLEWRVDAAVDARRPKWRDHREQREWRRTIPTWSVFVEAGGRLSITRAAFEGGALRPSGPRYDFAAWRQR